MSHLNCRCQVSLTIEEKLARSEKKIDELIWELAKHKVALGILEDALQEAGDDYPGSKMQEWCVQQVKSARSVLEVENFL